MTLDSINKNTNVIHQTRDNFQGEKPIDLINKTNPILILDEPQNMETTIAQQAIITLNPLFSLRYSATHKNVYNLLYKLTPIDAYEKRLVKKIEVMSVTKDNDFNNAYIQLTKIKTSPVSAKIKVYKKFKTGIKSALISIKSGDDLFLKTKNPDYKNFIVSDISAQHNFVRFLNGFQIRLGEETGGDQKEIMKIQIEKTVLEHFEKFEKLSLLQIKPLTLFFIDKVDNYLSSEGFIKKEFEKSFKKYQKNYRFFKNLDVNKVHRGYFSKMKSEIGMKKDKETFQLIMRDKEKLLSFSEPVQFIFSHSALREGWDNPNVFNICTLNLTHSNVKKRQEIGRGMRLPVNQDGERVFGNQNILTVIANENYEDFAKNLQYEYDEEYGPNTAPPISNKSDSKIIKLKTDFQLNPDFDKLWQKIARKTKYSIEIDSQKLIKLCVSDIQKEKSFGEINAKIISASLHIKEINNSISIITNQKGTGFQPIQKLIPLPNIVDIISSETNLSRSTIIQILFNITNLDNLFNNPQFFIYRTSKIIKDRLEELLVDGVQYIKTKNWHDLELFQDIETYKNLIVSTKISIYHDLVCDAQNEVTFAEELISQTNIKLIIKLPRKFVIDTPLGTYNPDWAIVYNHHDPHGKLINKLYFVTETKGSIDKKNLRQLEYGKIQCGIKHFSTIDVSYFVVPNAKSLLNELHKLSK
jgi:type III restriction enzyme